MIETTMKGASRSLPSWLPPVAGVTVVILLVVIGLIAGPRSLDPNSPEGTVQAYLNAVFAGDLETAAIYLEGEPGCEPELRGGATPTGSASLVRVEGNESEATVVVLITESSSDPLGGGGYEFEEWFDVVDRSGTWFIRHNPWPYFEMACAAP